jgi:hypothetical protein
MEVGRIFRAYTVELGHIDQHGLITQTQGYHSLGRKNGQATNTSARFNTAAHVISYPKLPNTK